MRVLIRQSVAGTEYWDTKEKRTILVPFGQDPAFEFETDPPSLLSEKNGVIKQSSSEEKEQSPASDKKSGDNIEHSNDGVKDDSYITNPEEELDAALRDEDEMDSPDFSSMTIKDMKEFAKIEKIDIPKNVTKRDDIMELLSDEMMERQLAE